MTAKRLPMRRIREILRLKHEAGLSHRAIARACSVGVGTVSLYVTRAREAGLAWPLPEEMDEAALEARLLRCPRSPTDPRPRPDPAHIHEELKRIEEPELVKRLGDEYAEYRGRTPMFIPGFSRRSDSGH